MKNQFLIFIFLLLSGASHATHEAFKFRVRDPWTEVILTDARVQIFDGSNRKIFDDVVSPSISIAMECGKKSRYTIEVSYSNLYYKLKMEFRPSDYLTQRGCVFLDLLPNDLYFEKVYAYEDSLYGPEWDNRDKKNSSDQGDEENYEEAIYVSGNEVMQQEIARNVVYPIECIELGIVGKVKVQFIVEKDGNISHIRAKNNVHGQMDFEAMRAVKKLNKWYPAKVDGLPVRNYALLPINFMLE